MAVREEIYRGSGEVGSSTPLPMADADTFGAAIGRGIGELGGALHKAKVADLQREYQSDYSAALVGLAGFTEEAEVARNKAREEAPLDGAGHAERVGGDLKALSENYLATIQNPRIRERLAPQVEGLIGRVVGGEDAWQRLVRRPEAIGTNAEKAANSFANQFQNNPDPTVLETALEGWDSYVQSVAGDNPALAEKLDRYGRKTMSVGFVRGLIETNPAGAIEVLTKGTIDDLIGDPDAKAVLLNQAQTALRMADADARRLQGQAEAQLRSEASEVRQRISRGELVDDKTVDGILGRAQALGLTELVDDVKYDQGKLKLSRETDKWTPAEWETTVNGLSAKVASGKATAQEQMTLKILQDLRSGKEARFKSDPHGAAALGGIAPPEVDVFGEVTQDQADELRVWAKAYRRSAGLNFTPYLTPPQLEYARAQIQSGAAGALEVSTHLRQLFGPADAAEIARQIDPGNKQLPLMMRMIPQVAEDYKRGIGALERNPKLFLQADATEIFRGYGDGIPPDQRDAMFAAAKSIAAGMSDRENLGDFTDEPALFGRIFRIALDRAAGQRGGGGAHTGGFGKWNDRAVWLPSDMAGADFARRVSRAGPEQWTAAGGGKPYYQGPDGKLQPVPDDWFARFKGAPLVTVAPGLYRPLGRDGRPLSDAHGRPWTFDVRRLP